MLKIAIQMKSEIRISGSLEGLQTLLVGGAPIFHTEISNIIQMLSTLDPKFSVHAEAMRNALKTAKTF